MTFVAERSAAPLPPLPAPIARPTVRFASWLARAAERGRRLADRHPRLIAYGIPVLVAVAATLGWFRPGRFVAAGDIAPFLRDGLASELTSSWGHRLTGAGSPSYEIARSFEVLLVRIVALFGGSALVAQRIFYALVFAAPAFGVACFVRALVARPWVACVAGLLGAFNPFVLVMLPNPLFPVAIGTAGVLGGCLLRAADGRRIPAAVVALTTLPLGYLSVNPPMLAVLAGWTVLVCALASALVGPGGARRAVIAAGRAAPLVVLFGLWWLVPMARVLTSTATVSVSAVTGAEQWAWSHADNSIGNVLTLKAHWGWAHPDFYPYADRLDAALWPGLRWLLPLGALASVVLGRRRVRAVALLAVAGVLVVMAKGLHWPGPGLNRWLYDTVPGYWLLREPMSKVGPLLVVVLVTLFALAMSGVADRLADRAHDPDRALARRATTAMLGAVVIGALVAPWPLWNGDVIPDDRGALPSAHVAIPDAWYDLAEQVNASASPGKVLVLPVNRFYQVTTDWGFHGVNSPVQQLVTRPVIQPMPGGYFAPPVGFTDLVHAVEAALVDGQHHRLDELVAALGVSQIIVRHDIVPSAANRELADSDALARSLASWSGVSSSSTFEVGDVFELDDAGAVVRATVDLVSAESGISGHALVAAIADGATTVETDVELPDRLVQPDGDAESFTAASAAVLRVIPDAAAQRTHVVEVDDASIRVQEAATPTVDGLPVASAPLVVARTGSGPAMALEDGDGMHHFDGSAVTVRLQAGDELTVWTARASRTVSPWAPLEDCNAVSDLDRAGAGLASTEARGVLRLQARAHSACRWATIDRPSDADAMVRVAVDVRTVSGRPGRVCVWLVGPDRCAASETVTGDGWQEVETFVRLDDATSELRLYVYADGTTGGTVAEYRDVVAHQLEPSDQIAVPTVRARDIPLGSGGHELAFGTEPLRIGAFSPVEDCHAFDDRDAAATGLSVSAYDDRVLLTAIAHTACSWAPVPDAEDWSRIRVRYRHRTLSGLPGRLCLWQIGPDRCAHLSEPSSSSSSWRDVDDVVDVAAGTTAVQLYLYADGPDSDARTVVEFDDLQLTPAAVDAFVVRDRSPARAVAPEVTARRVRSTGHDVHIAGADGRFLLVLAETWDPGWQLTGLPDGWTAEHARADGYANAWVIRGSGDAELTVTYGPERTASLARTASAVAVLAGVIVLAAAGVRRRRTVPAAS